MSKRSRSQWMPRRAPAQSPVSSPPLSSPPLAPQKASYEAYPDVQRWLRRQDDEAVGSKPPFTPTLLAHQRDRQWVLSSLERFYEEDLITDVLRTLKSGKEATVYCCTADPRFDMEFLAAKVYRPRMFRSLQNDVVYRRSRAQRDETGHIVRDDRRWRAHQKSSRGQSERVAAWIRDEFETQQLVYAAGANVPRPISQIGNGLLMELVGDGGWAAPLLHEVRLSDEEAPQLFADVLHTIELFLTCHRIHGDLSTYNILYHSGRLTIIDFAQAVDPRYNPDVFPLLHRDVERVCDHFARYGVQADAEGLTHELWTRYLFGEL